ncbi:MAG: hypothetical protein MUE98_04185 [Rhodobacteraceae bacterium]|jgi:hypothetical protein|nr:hypothetical protein [Paracoccaceae bacterium]
MSTSARSAAVLLLAAAPAWAEAPLSAIDWLSDSITEPVVTAAPAPAVPGATGGTLPEPVTTRSLDAPRADAAGLLPPSVTGLPKALWGPGDSGDIARMIRAETVETLPAGQALLTAILLAEADPPASGGEEPTLLLARVDKLLDLGLVEEASALLALAGTASPELFRRAFDVALLLGSEDSACDAMRARPDVAPTFPARIFCLARGGDWTAAALTLGTTRALGQLAPGEEELLSRFLDPDLYEEDGALAPPTRPSPLVFRMFEAVGEPLPTGTLPRAFAHADLRPTSGWKAQVEAAERLARTGAIDPNRLLGLYTERSPAASGGVWERVRAVQALDAALTAGDAAAVAAALPRAWDEMHPVGLSPALSAMTADRLAPLAAEIEGGAGTIAFRLALLSPEYEAAAVARAPADREERLLVAIARGETLPRPEGSVALALAGLGKGALPPARAAALIDRGQLGEALLFALDDLAAGRAGDPRRLADALATFRAVGLEGTARRAALEYLILAEPA